MPDSHGRDFSIHENCKSVIVWNVFSTVAYDYHYKNEFLPKILMYLNYRWGMNGYSFGYDNWFDHLESVDSVDDILRTISKWDFDDSDNAVYYYCLLYTSPSPRDLSTSRMPSSA